MPLTQRVTEREPDNTSDTPCTFSLAKLKKPRLWRVGGVVTQRIANPCMGVRFPHSPPPYFHEHMARVPSEPVSKTGQSTNRPMLWAVWASLQKSPSDIAMPTSVRRCPDRGFTTWASADHRLSECGRSRRRGLRKPERTLAKAGSIKGDRTFAMAPLERAGAGAHQHSGVSTAVCGRGSILPRGDWWAEWKFPMRWLIWCRWACPLATRAGATSENFWCGNGAWSPPPASVSLLPQPDRRHHKVKCRGVPKVRQQHLAPLMRWPLFNSVHPA